MSYNPRRRLERAQQRELRRWNRRAYPNPHPPIEKDTRSARQRRRAERRERLANR